MSLPPRFLRRARTLLWTAFSIVVILAAVLVGLGKLLMPYSHHYRPQLEAWLSRELHQSVSVDSFSGEWSAFGPSLTLRGLRLQPQAGSRQPVAISEAVLDLNPLNLLVPGGTLYNFRVLRADVRLLRAANGEYSLSGLGISRQTIKEPGGFALRDLVGIGELILEDSRIEYVDAGNDVHLRLGDAQARVLIDDESVAFEVQAEFASEDGGDSYGELDATGVLRFSKDSRIEAAGWHVAVRELLLQQLQARLPPRAVSFAEGRGSVELWGSWERAGTADASGMISLHAARLGKGEGSIAVDRLQTRLAAHYAGKEDWRVDFSDLQFEKADSSWSIPNLALARRPADDVGLWISADRLPLQGPLRLARLATAMAGKAWPRNAPQSARGVIEDFDLVLDAKWQPRFASGSARQLSLTEWGRWPDVHGLDAEIDFTSANGSLWVASPQLDVEWPRIFSERLSFELPRCRLEIGWRRMTPEVTFSECGLRNDDLALLGDMQLKGKGIGKRPIMDANFLLLRARVDRLAPYWPGGLLKPRVTDWLKRSLVSGNVASGRFVTRGDMDHWPFQHGAGRFEAVVHVQDGEIEYLDGWPRARGVDSVVRFTNASMTAEATVEEAGGVPVQSATVRIDDLKTPVLVFQYEARSTLNAMMGFVAKSPLRLRVGTDLGRFRFAGPASTSGVVRAPLGSASGELGVSARADLLGNLFSDPDSGFEIGAIEGLVQYDQQGFSAQGLEANYRNQPARIDLRAGSDLPERFRADITGRFDARDVLPEALQTGTKAGSRFAGSSDWRISVIVPAPGGTQLPEPFLEVSSDTLGLEFELPEPLGKVAGEAWPLLVRYPLSGSTRLLELQLGERLALRFEMLPGLPADPSSRLAVRRAEVVLGKGTVGMPADGFVRIGGSAGVLDLDGWTDLVREEIAGGGKMAGLELEDCTITARRLHFLDRRFDDVEVQLGVAAGAITGSFKGQDIDGRVSYVQEGGSTSLTAQFERLLLGKPLSEGIEMKTDPRNLPPLHLYARSLQYAGIEMGETRIEAYPVAEGFHFEKVEARSDALGLTATGDWIRTDSGHRSDFSILMTSESLGSLLQTMDISSSLQGGQTMVRFDAWWPGSPAAFALSRLNGEVEFNVSRGQLTNASPGGGRLLGLLSVQALPRRLALDFRDVFDSGFDFETAAGTFRMENGTATTDDVLLSSSAAKIALSGSTDLVAKRYDQVMTVMPGVGNTLPVIGAIAGGPGGAAAGLALQGLLQEELGQAAQVRYAITGSWDDPLIEPILDRPSDG